jgi:hypothetical protein
MQQRPCAIWSCNAPGTVLDYQRTEEHFREGGYQAEYLCLRHARAQYPDLFPPPPVQLEIPAMSGRRLRKMPSSGYVPLDRAPVP